MARAGLRKSAGGGHKAKVRSKGLKHMIKTGLPPGIDREYFRDPGSAARRKSTKAPK